MSRRRVVSVGNRRDYPRESWRPRDFEDERQELDAISEPLLHVAGRRAARAPVPSVRRAHRGRCQVAGDRCGNREAHRATSHEA